MAAVRSCGAALAFASKPLKVTHAPRLPFRRPGGPAFWRPGHPTGRPTAPPPRRLTRRPAALLPHSPPRHPATAPQHDMAIVIAALESDGTGGWDPRWGGRTSGGTSGGDLSGRGGGVERGKEHLGRRGRNNPPHHQPTNPTKPTNPINPTIPPALYFVPAELKLNLEVQVRALAQHKDAIYYVRSRDSIVEHIRTSLGTHLTMVLLRVYPRKVGARVYHTTRKVEVRPGLWKRSAIAHAPQPDPAQPGLSLLCAIPLAIPTLNRPSSSHRDVEWPQGLASARRR